MRRQSVLAMAIALSLGGAYFGAGPSARPAEAQASGGQTEAGQSQAAAGKDNPAYYELQRSTQIDRYHVVAMSGVGRGENLYFYKCWMCHNDYTIESNYGDKAPFLHLKDLFQREKLTTNGKPVNDETITEKIKNGGPGMPSFHTTMSDADIQDLVFNETWFIGEGLLWAGIAWTAIGPAPLRRWWMVSAAVAVLGLTAIGLLSAFGAIGKVVIG